MISAWSICSWSQTNYPQHPVKIIVSVPPGSGADTSARFIAKHLSAALAQPFIVENRPGADSVIAAKLVADAAPDGHTMFVASNSPMVTNAAVFKHLSYDPIKDFEPISGIARFPMILVVPVNSPISNVQDLIDAARKAPGKLNYASGTSTYRLAIERFHARHGISSTAIPYKGTAPAIMDVASGIVDYSMAEISSVLPLIRAGKLRALAVASNARHKDLPAVPTFSETGTTGYESYAWTGAFFPAGVPVNIVQQVSKIIRTLLDSSEGEKFIADQGGTVFAVDPDDLRKFQLEEMTAVREIVRTANIPVE
ncbi:tripartite tricarboxylate transporter substrate binding protein [Alcaligenaceae bacterium]|nr:tripartite tricarboxylate transporter substrate binding protein [Alcaligenaceae bacterium]